MHLAPQRWLVMKKQEFIHLHGLLAQVATFYERQTGQIVDTSQYETLGVQPTSIHQSKTEQKEAVAALSKCLTAEVADEAAASTLASIE